MWRDLETPTVDADATELAVSVVVEAADDPHGLTPIALASLGRQTYPDALIDVIEANGEREPEGDVIVLLEAGAIPSPDFVAAHARWHGAVVDAVSLGPVLRIDPKGLDRSALERGLGAEPLAAALRERLIDEDDPFDLIGDLTRSYTDVADGLVVAGGLGSLGVRRETVQAAGGRGEQPSPLHRLDLAQRLQCYGAVFAPEPRAAAWVADGRASAELARAATAAATGGERLEVRHPEAASIVALPPFRTVASPRRYRRPAVVVNVDAGGSDAAGVAATIAPLLGGVLGDLELRLQVPEDHPERGELARLVADDPRARIAPSSLAGFCDSPFQVTVPAEALPDSRTLADLHRLAIGEGAGAMHVTVPGAPPQDVMIEVVASGAWERARRIADRRGEAVEVVLGQVFGERWVSGVEVNVRAHGVDEPHVTEHGPLAAATDLRRERVQHLRFRSRADDLERATRSIADRVIAERLRARSDRRYANRLEARLRSSRGEGDG
jgi:hypothetical protein